MLRNKYRAAAMDDKSITCAQHDMLQASCDRRRASISCRIVSNAQQQELDTELYWLGRVMPPASFFRRHPSPFVTIAAAAVVEKNGHLTHPPRDNIAHTHTWLREAVQLRLRYSSTSTFPHDRAMPSYHTVCFIQRVPYSSTIDAYRIMHTAVPEERRQVDRVAARAAVVIAVAAVVRRVEDLVAVVVVPRPLVRVAQHGVRVLELLEALLRFRFVAHLRCRSTSSRSRSRSSIIMHRCPNFFHACSSTPVLLLFCCGVELLSPNTISKSVFKQIKPSVSPLADETRGVSTDQQRSKNSHSSDHATISSWTSEPVTA